MKNKLTIGLVLFVVAFLIGFFPQYQKVGQLEKAAAPPPPSQEGISLGAATPLGCAV